MSRWIPGLLMVLLVAGLGYHVWVVGRLERERDDLGRRLATLRESVETLTAEVQASKEPLAPPRIDKAVPSSEMSAERAEPSEEEQAAAARARAEEIVAEALVAYESMEPQKFLASWFALVDLGEPGYPLLIEMLNGLDLERLNEIGDALEGDLAGKAKLFGGMFIRLPAINRAMEHILGRDPTLDQASLMALSIIGRFDVPTGDAAGRAGRIQALVEAALLGGDEETGVPGMSRILPYAGIQALQKTGGPEAVAALEELYLADPGQFRHAVPNALGQLESPEALEAMARLYHESEEGNAETILRSLGRMEGEEANEQLWSILEDARSPRSRRTVLEALATRAENAERLVDVLASPSLDARDREAILYRVRAESPERTNELLWSIYERAPVQSDRGVALARLVYEGDARAAHAAVDLLVAGTAPLHVRGAAARLDASIIESRRADIVGAAADFSRPVPERLAAARAVARIDRVQAVQALVEGYERLDEGARRQVVSSLSSDFVGGERSREALRRISEADPSESIRRAAGKQLDRSR